jgi:hypothetical protein
VNAKGNFENAVQNFEFEVVFFLVALKALMTVLKSV